MCSALKYPYIHTQYVLRVYTVFRHLLVKRTPAYDVHIWIESRSSPGGRRPVRL